VLTTKWVDGERLASSAADDVPRLCGVALNAYLTMLLDTGTLHCDPHPGNLLRTPDGRLCILDWGMVIKVPEDLQLSLLEFIANLSAENYEEVPNDLVKLSFVPADKIDELRASGLTFAISTMLKLASEGGGPKGAMQVSYCRPLAYARVPALACSRIDRVCVCVCEYRCRYSATMHGIDLTAPLRAHVRPRAAAHGCAKQGEVRGCPLRV
jgi:hypothetical protein